MTDQLTRLVLVRHAKSDWGDPGLDDHERPLNARGMHDAPRMAEQFAATGFRPDAILSSTALRAATTAGFFGIALNTPVEHQDRLYGASARELLRAASESGARSVMVVAHNPGISSLAGELSGHGIGVMPTCAVATFVWNTADWNVATAVDPVEWEWSTPVRD